MASRGNLAEGHKLGIELVRERVKDSGKPVQAQLLAAEMLTRFWRLEAAHSGLTESDIAAIENMAQHGAERVWNALLQVGGKSVH